MCKLYEFCAELSIYYIYLSLYPSIYLSIIIINYEIYLFIFLLRIHFARGSLRFSANSYFLLLEQNFSKLKIMNFFKLKLSVF